MIPNQKPTLSCYPSVPTALPAPQDKAAHAVWGAEQGLQVTTVSWASCRHMSTQFQVSAKPKCSGFQWIMLTWLTPYRRGIPRPVPALSPPAESHDCVWPEAAAEGPSKGSQSWSLRHKVQGRGSVWTVCVVRTCIPWGRGREETRTASGALLMGSARGNKLILATNYVWATHQHSASQVRELCSLPTAQGLSWAPRTVTKALCSQAPQERDHSPAPWNQWDSGHSPDSSPSYINTLSFRSTDFSDWSCQAMDVHKDWLGPKKWRTEAAVRVCLTLSELGEY